MLEIDKIQVGDVGTAFRIRVMDDGVLVDISSCTTKHIIFKKPSGAVVVKDADFYTDGTDGYMQYVSVANDLDQAGKWKIQGYVEFATVGWHTVQDSFLVSDNLEAV